MNRRKNILLLLVSLAVSPFAWAAKNTPVQHLSVPHNIYLMQNKHMIRSEKNTYQRIKALKTNAPFSNTIAKTADMENDSLAAAENLSPYPVPARSSCIIYYCNIDSLLKYIPNDNSKIGS